MGDLKYKVGDKVRIKSLDWYNENKDEHGYIPLFKPSGLFVPDMSRYCNNIMTIKDICYGTCYRMKEDFWHYNWTDEMIEGLVQDENNHLTETVVDYVKESNDRYRIVIDPRFDIEVDEGEYYAVRRKKEYPKTFLGCCDVLGIEDTISRGVKGYKAELFDTLQKLYICRDAYWKIAGDEMGLGKPWEPDWNDEEQDKYGFHSEVKYTIINSAMFVFPTEEMRDAFFNAFRDDIEKCKELI